MHMASSLHELLAQKAAPLSCTHTWIQCTLKSGHYCEGVHRGQLLDGLQTSALVDFSIFTATEGQAFLVAQGKPLAVRYNSGKCPIYP